MKFPPVLARGNTRVAVGLAAASLVLTTCVPTAELVTGSTVVADVLDRVEVAESESPSTAIVPNLPLPTLSSSGAAQPVPAPQPATAPAPADPAVSFQPVNAQLPQLRVAASVAGEVVGQVLEVEGVAFATAVEVGDVPVAGDEGPVNVRVAAVDPAGFRVLTPQVTADHLAVWQRIVEGDAAFTHDAGHRLEVPLGASLSAPGDALLRIGAYASNGIPPIADAIVSHQTADELGLTGTTELLVALDEGADPSIVGAQLAALTGGEATVIAEPVEQQAFLTGAESRAAFEPFSYIDYGDGMIAIDPEWVRRNIVSAPMPILKGNVICHRLLVGQLHGALQEVVDAGLSHLIDPSQYGGCWVPRHIDFNPAKPLSMHAWGLAADFNVSTNGLGQVPQMDQRIVEIFDRWGFNWGGRWSRPDGMHFELGALLSTGG